MATTKEIAGNKKRAYQKATMKMIGVKCKTSLLCCSGISELNNGELE